MEKKKSTSGTGKDTTTTKTAADDGPDDGTRGPSSASTSLLLDDLGTRLYQSLYEENSHEFQRNSIARGRSSGSGSATCTIDGARRARGDDRQADNDDDDDRRKNDNDNDKNNLSAFEVDNDDHSDNDGDDDGDDVDLEHHPLIRKQQQKYGKNTDVTHAGNSDHHQEDDSPNVMFSRFVPPTNHRCFKNINVEDMVFAVRIATGVTLASLFVLLLPPDAPFIPHAAWIMTTACTVSWNASIDTATTIKKALERSSGTVLGALLGFAAGFFSLWVALPSEHNNNHDESFGSNESSATATAARTNSSLRIQAIVMGVSLVVLCLSIPFIASASGYRTSYAARLIVLSFCVVGMGFYTSSHNTQEAIQIGLYRSVNITLGCIFATFGALLIGPRSTKSVLETKVIKQVKMAGRTNRLVLESAYRVISGSGPPPPRFEALIRSNLNIKDDVYDACIQCTESWRSCRALFPFLKWDPTYRFRMASSQQQTYFVDQMSAQLARVFRLQTIAIQMDMIVRFGSFLFLYEEDEGVRGDNNLVGGASLEILLSIGERVEQMLDIQNVQLQERSKAAQQLLEHDLGRIRRLFDKVLRDQSSATTSTSTSTQQHNASVENTTRAPTSRRRMPSFEGRMPLMELEGREQILLIFQLVEQLIIRSVRMHFYRLAYEDQKDEIRPRAPSVSAL